MAFNKLPFICKNSLRSTFTFSRDIVLSSRAISSSFCTACASSKNSHHFLSSLETTRPLFYSLSYTPNAIQIREKSNWRNSNKKNRSAEYESDSDSDDEDFIQKESAKTAGIKVVQVMLDNLRIDCIIKHAFGIARNKSEVLFYENKIRINGKKPMKKGTDTTVGDEVDIIKGLSPDNPNFIIVSRVEILRVRPSGDYLSVTIRKQRNMTIENYSEDPWIEDTSDETTKEDKELA